LEFYLVPPTRLPLTQTVRRLTADLINEHRHFEAVFQELNFKKVTEWAR